MPLSEEDFTALRTTGRLYASSGRGDDVKRRLADHAIRARRSKASWTAIAGAAMVSVPTMKRIVEWRMNEAAESE